MLEYNKNIYKKIKETQIREQIVEYRFNAAGTCTGKKVLFL
jgi:hypothetical protein